jgi:hypothetical protein
MNKFGGQFASGVGGGRFIGAVWAIHYLSLSLAHSLPLTLTGGLGHAARSFAHCLSVSLSLARSVSLSHSLSLAHSLPLTLSLSRAENFPKAAYLRRKLPPRPTPDTQIRSERKKKKKKKLARIHQIPARFRQNPAGYCRNHC